MEDDLLENARRQAEKADTSICAAALLRIARAESASDVSRARRTLLEGLDAVQKLFHSSRSEACFIGWIGTARNLPIAG